MSRPLPPRKPGMISPTEQLALKRGFVPLDPRLIGAGTGAMAHAGGNLYVSPAGRDQIMAWAREYEALAREIDRRYRAGRVEGVDDLEERAGFLEHLLEEALEEASTSEEDLATAEDTKPLMDLEGQVADLYHQFLTEQPGGYSRFTPDRFSAEHGITTREGVLADTLRHMLADAHRSHGGELSFVDERSDPYRATDEQLIAAAADAHRRRIELRARYKGPKRFPATPKIPPTQKNPPLDHVLEPPGKTKQIGAESGRPVRDGIARYVSRDGSYRYVLYEAGVALAGLQVMSSDGKQGVIATVYTRPERRRQRLAHRLLLKARRDFPRGVEHAHHLTDLGQQWKRGIGENPPWRRRPRTNPALLPQDAWSKLLRAVANRTVVKLYPDEAASATAGGCWIVGEALRRLHGGDLEVVIEESPRTGNQWCSPIVHHVVLRLPDGRLLDGDGLHADDDMLAKARGSWAIALGRFHLGALDPGELLACQTTPPKPSSPKFKKLVSALKGVGAPPPATRRNPDDGLRALERAVAASGTREDKIRLDVARFRHGQPSVLGMLARWLPFDVQFEGGRYVPTAGVLWQRAIGHQATEIEVIGRRLYGQNFWFEPPAGGHMAVGIRANQDYERWLGHERHLAGEIERAGYRVEWSATPWGEGERVTGFSIPLDVERARLAHDLHDVYAAMIAAARKPQENPPRGTLRARRGGM